MFQFEWLWPRFEKEGIETTYSNKKLNIFSKFLSAVFVWKCLIVFHVSSCWIPLFMILFALGVEIWKDNVILISSLELDIAGWVCSDCGGVFIQMADNIDYCSKKSSDRYVVEHSIFLGYHLHVISFCVNMNSLSYNWYNIPSLSLFSAGYWHQKDTSRWFRSEDSWDERRSQGNTRWRGCTIYRWVENKALCL